MAEILPIVAYFNFVAVNSNIYALLYLRKKITKKFLYLKKYSLRFENEL